MRCSFLQKSISFTASIAYCYLKLINECLLRVGWGRVFPSFRKISELVVYMAGHPYFEAILLSEQNFNLSISHSVWDIQYGTLKLILMAVNSHLIVCDSDIVTTFLDLFVKKP